MKVFDKPGPQNTAEAVKLAAQRARELGIKELVVASNTGRVARAALDAFKGGKVIVVTRHSGFSEPWKNEMPNDVYRDLISRGAFVHTGTHVLSGIERSFNSQFKGVYPTQIVAETLRLFGQGTKVCVEVAIIASDGGLLSGSMMVAVGGTGEGADTALVLTPSTSNRFLELRIHEIICKPE
ncbi:MAG: hypothetical protein HZB92_00625 [Euryarchaeota archaeon]|nr:hypothetical protein [Euryarchaeota archaeon]